MVRPYWLLSLLPVIGRPLAFWLENSAAIKRSAANARRGYSAGGAGGGLIGLAAALGRAPSEGGRPGRDNAFGEAVRDIAQDPNTDSQLGAMLRDLDPDATPDPESKPR